MQVAHIQACSQAWCGGIEWREVLHSHMLRVLKKAFLMSGTPSHLVPCPEYTEVLQTIHVKNYNLSHSLNGKADIPNIQW